MHHPTRREIFADVMYDILLAFVIFFAGAFVALAVLRLGVRTFFQR